MSDQDFDGGGYDDGYEDQGPVAGKQSNVLGIVGFVLAFCISPIGLLVSLIAAVKPPRGFAIAGVVVGLIGTGLWGLLGGGVFYAMSMPIVKIQSEITEDYMMIDQELAAHQSSNGSLPATLDEVTALSSDQKLDPWGNAYEYSISAAGGSWSLRILGPDEESGTSDDLVLDGGLHAFDLAFKFQPVSEDWNEAAKAAAEAEKAGE